MGPRYFKMIFLMIEIWILFNEFKFLSNKARDTWFWLLDDKKNCN